MEDKILYLFIDESGDLTFSPKGGSKYFLLTCVSTLTPLEGRGAIAALTLGHKYELMAQGRANGSYSASAHPQSLRDKIFDCISGIKDFEVDCIVAQKNKANWALYESFDIKPGKTGDGFKLLTKKNQERFYMRVSETLLKYLLKRYLVLRKNQEIKKVVVIFSAIFNNDKQESIKKHLKQLFNEQLGIIPHIVFRPAQEDPNCQIADYCGWAIFTKWEHESSELRPYNAIKDKIKNEFPMFRRGEKTFY